MTIEIRCSGCNARLRLPQTEKGKRVRCPQCGHLNEAALGPVKTGLEPDVVADKLHIPQDKTRVSLEPPGAHAGGVGTFTAPSDDAGDEPKPDGDVPAPTALPGYQLLKELGRGGMGRVFLARQKSLDRLVALKVMHPRRAKDPSFVARFMREAYAAAQLVHHHIVQIYDIDAGHGLPFFAMEYVKGETLTDLVRREGKLDPEVAAGYILQAARGLKFGHDLGMVHRDVKPDNLLVNDQGIVKVADLGLVKIPYMEEVAAAAPDDEAADSQLRSTHVTRVGAGVGTPTYMAPEQARDAAHVDARADIYSLGCTLYALLTAQPPFDGATAIEVLTKHATAPLVPPEALSKRVPKALSAIVAKMLAKKPADRFASMDAVIAALEKYLGIQQAGAFTPREEHAQLLEQCVKEFNDAPQARLRTLIMNGFLGGCAALIVACLLMRWLWPAGALLGFAVLTPLAYFVVHGWRERSFLFLKAREWLLGVGAVELLYALGGLAIFALVLYLFHLLWLWVVVGICALGLAVAFYAVIDRQLAAQRRPTLERVEKLLRTLRLHGLDERALGLFVCKYSGRDWEEFFESLYGYPAKLKARTWLRGETAQRRHRFAPWRDPIILWIDARQKARKQAWQRRQLQSTEAKALQAQGVAVAEAEQKAAKVAEVMVEQAALAEADMAAYAAAGPKAIVPPPESSQAPAVPAVAAPQGFQKLLETALNPDTSTMFVMPSRRFRFSILEFVAGIIGARLRFFAGALLCFCCVYWIKQNAFFESDSLRQSLTAMIDEGSTQRWDGLGEPLTVPLLPATLLVAFNSFNVGAAGLILMISAFLGGWKTSLIAWPAALLILLGPVALPAAGPISGGVLGLAAGLAIAIVGCVIRRRLRKAVADSDAAQPNAGVAA